MSLSERIQDWVASVSCSFRAFMFACGVVVVWAALGPHYSYSDTWQLVINTGTTIVTFLMAFLIAAYQQRSDSQRSVLIQLTERHVELIELHTDEWQRHAQETHSLAQATHALVREVHQMQRRLDPAT